MGERRTDNDGYVWEYSGWTGNWEPVRDNWGNQLREGGGPWWGSGGRRERDEGGEGCFVTTACVEARGLPDDCAELEGMREFRDGYVAGLPHGAEVIEAYYALAPQIVAAIDRSPERAVVYEELYSRWLTASLELIRAGKHEEALENCVEVLRELAERYPPHETGGSTGGTVRAFHASCVEAEGRRVPPAGLRGVRFGADRSRSDRAGRGPCRSSW